jgi:hypothetical protein
VSVALTWRSRSIPDQWECRRQNERDKQLLLTERERQINAVRSFETDLHRMEVRETTLANQIRDKEALEERIVTMKREVVACSAEIKVILCFDVKKGTFY